MQQAAVLRRALNEERAAVAACVLQEKARRQHAELDREANILRKKEEQLQVFGGVGLFPCVVLIVIVIVIEIVFLLCLLLSLTFSLSPFYTLLYCTHRGRCGICSPPTNSACRVGKVYIYV
jgi:hypothetical protein